MEEGNGRRERLYSPTNSHQTVSDLLEEATGLSDEYGKVVVIEDCVETNASFILHQLIKRSLSLPSSSLIFLSFSHPFSHYLRILRKLGCNIASYRDNGRFIYLDMIGQELPEGRNSEDGLAVLYGKIQKIICELPKANHIKMIIDDFSLMEVLARGDSNAVLGFLHYCRSLTSEFGCSLIVLNHGDIYSSLERPAFLLQMEYLADVLIKAEPLATGFAADVHGQLTIINRGTWNGAGRSRSKISNFHFQVKETGVEYFYPGSRN